MEHVAVKVQYPNILKATQNDFKNIDQIKRFLFGFSKCVDVNHSRNEGSASRGNYLREKEEINSFEKSFENEFPDIRVPKTFDDFCSETILTMEFLEGDDFEKTISYSQRDKDFLGQLLFDSYIYSFLKKKNSFRPQNGNYFF